jgi:hypothetical protein
VFGNGLLVKERWAPKNPAFLFIINFLLGFIHYGGDVTLLIRLIFYIIYNSPIISPPSLCFSERESPGVHGLLLHLAEFLAPGAVPRS